MIIPEQYSFKPSQKRPKHLRIVEMFERQVFLIVLRFLITYRSSLDAFGLGTIFSTNSISLIHEYQSLATCV